MFTFSANWLSGPDSKKLETLIRIRQCTMKMHGRSNVSNMKLIYPHANCTEQLLNLNIATFSMPGKVYVTELQLKQPTSFGKQKIL